MQVCITRSWVWRLGMRVLIHVHLDRSFLILLIAFISMLRPGRLNVLGAAWAWGLPHKDSTGLALRRRLSIAVIVIYRVAFVKGLLAIFPGRHRDLQRCYASKLIVFYYRPTSTRLWLKRYAVRYGHCHLRLLVRSWLIKHCLSAHASIWGASHAVIIVHTLILILLRPVLDLYCRWWWENFYFGGCLSTVTLRLFTTGKDAFQVTVAFLHHFNRWFHEFLILLAIIDYNVQVS